MVHQDTTIEIQHKQVSPIASGSLKPTIHPLPTAGITKFYRFPPNFPTWFQEIQGTKSPHNKIQHKGRDSQCGTNRQNQSSIY